MEIIRFCGVTLNTLIPFKENENYIYDRGLLQVLTVQSGVHIIYRSNTDKLGGGCTDSSSSLIKF